uniref:Dolichyl-diphosphooligosaccharide--protein glycosyltransferase subunit 1 n=1 Tax=Heterorhabditis bacteriophora TaxID=37862 RepID=A0A1I7W681_HETBA
MERRPDESHPTYLDTTGRTVVVLQKDNLVGEHIQTLTVSYPRIIYSVIYLFYFFSICKINLENVVIIDLSYEFEFTNMIREPLLSTAFFFLLFMVIIIYVRFDFTIVIVSVTNILRTMLFCCASMLICVI